MQIIMEGGLVQAIVSDEPAEIGLTVEVIEYDDDIDQSQPPNEDQILVEQSDGTMIVAYRFTHAVEKSQINIHRQD